MHMHMHIHAHAHSACTGLLRQQYAVRLREAKDDKGELAPLREQQPGADGGAQLEPSQGTDQRDDETLEGDEADRHAQHERCVGPCDAHVDREACGV